VHGAPLDVSGSNVFSWYHLKAPFSSRTPFDARNMLAALGKRGQKISLVALKKYQKFSQSA